MCLEKYGFDNFDFVEIDSASSIEELNEKESYWIAFYNSTDKNLGYNLDSGGTNCFKSESTKRKIGETTRDKWNNPEMAKLMMDGLRKGTFAWRSKAQDERIDWTCPICGKTLRLAKWETRNKKACSISCAGRIDDNIEHLRRNGEIIHRKNVENKTKLREEILKWCKCNCDVIKNCPYNNISKTLSPMLDYIGIRDIRAIFICFDVHSRKDLLSYLKGYLDKENIC